MEKIYTLDEIKAFRQQTVDKITEVFSEKTRHGYKTAREIAEATNGLCSSQHIANTCKVRYANMTSYNGKAVRRGGTTEIRTHHYIEVDDNNNPIRDFYVTNKYSICTYKMD